MDEQEYILRYCIILLKKDPLALCIRVFEICHLGLPTFFWILPTFYMDGIYMCAVLLIYKFFSVVHFTY